MTFPIAECLAGPYVMWYGTLKKRRNHWFTTNFMKQSTDGFCISNLLVYFAQKAFELASMYHKERSKGTHVSKCKTQSTLRVFAFLKGNKAVILVIQIKFHLLSRAQLCFLRTTWLLTAKEFKVVLYSSHHLRKTKSIAWKLLSAELFHAQKPLGMATTLTRGSKKDP